MTVTILSIAKAIPIYAQVLHSELYVSVFNFELASTSFVLYNIKLATIVLICLCLQNKEITNIIMIIEIIEEVNRKMFTLLLRKKFYKVKMYVLHAFVAN